MVRSIVILLAVVLAGCGGVGRLSYESPAEAYEKGMTLFDRGKYARAAQYFQAVFDFGREQKWAADAQIQLARAYRANEEYILAASEYSRFTELYRGDERLPDVEFEHAMTFLERSPAYELDQSNTERGIEVFYVYMQRYPQHDSVAVAREHVTRLRGKLAHKQFAAAGLYERRELYEAAALSYEIVFDKYPDTDMADDALLGAIRCYVEFSDQSITQRQPDRLQKAVDHYLRLIQIFPESTSLEEARILYDRAQSQLDRLLAQTTER